MEKKLFFEQVSREQLRITDKVENLEGKSRLIQSQWKVKLYFIIEVKRKKIVFLLDKTESTFLLDGGLGGRAL